MSNFFPPPAAAVEGYETGRSCTAASITGRAAQWLSLLWNFSTNLKIKKKMNKKPKHCTTLKNSGLQNSLRTSASSAETRNAHSDSSRIQKAFSQVKIPRSKHFFSVKKKIWVHQYLWVETSLKWHTGCFAYFQIFIFSTEDMDSHMCYNKLVKYNKALQSVESLRIVYCEVKCSISSALGVLSLKWQ